MAITEAAPRRVEVDDLPPLPPRRRTLGKRLRDAVSLCLWTVMACTRWLAERVRRSPAGTQAHHRPTGGGAAPAAPSRFSRLALHVTVVALVGMPLAAQGLRLAARPLVPAFRPLEARSTVVAADGSTLAVLHDGVNRRPVALDEVPQVLRDAVVAAEDQRFWQHGGFDTEAIGRAALANLQAGGVTQGASTITQQLAKMNHVGDRTSFTRKGRELLYAVALEERFSKQQLLERYLNQVYFGAQAYGVGAAAEELFATDVGGLSVEQAALLAGLIRAPAALDPRAEPDAALARRNEVLSAMAALGHLDPEAAEAARAAPLEVVPRRPPLNSEPAVVEAVKREFLANPAFGASPDDRRRLLQTGGLTVKVTVDPALQAAARSAARWVPERLGAAIVAVDPRSGRVAALSTAGAAAGGHFDVATQGGRQPGSTFKPLVAAAALEAGMPEWQALVGDGPVEIDYQRGLDPWRVDNFGGWDYGLIGLREAVVDSVNTAFAQLGVALGTERIVAMTERLGIDPATALGPPESRGPSIALGGLTHGVSPLQLASAYSTFAANGARTAPYLIEEVLGPDGGRIYRAEPKAEKVLDPTVNAALVDILVEAVEEGTGAAAALPGWDVLGKTGTTEDSADAWFVGAVPTLAATVWIGHPDRRQPVPGLTGGSMAAPVWRAFMSTALRGQAPVGFEEPAAGRGRVAPLTLPTARPCPPTVCTGDAL